MSVRTKTPTDGSKAAQLAVTDPTTTTTVRPEINPSEAAALGNKVETSEPIQETAEALTESRNDIVAGIETNPETDTAGSITGDNLVTTTAPTHLGKQEAIARVNTANHDLVTLLEPLLTTAVTQKRLAALMVSQIGLSEAEGDTWVFHVKQLLEAKRQAAQSLVRSLIDQA